MTQASHSYDTCGNVGFVTAPAYAYAYDGAGRPKTVTSPSGDTVTNTYSGEFLSSTSFAGGTIGYTHLPCGKLSSTTRGAETSRLTYDGPLVTREVRGGSVPATLSFAYDTDFRPTQLQLQGVHPRGRRYDDARGQALHRFIRQVRDR